MENIRLLARYKNNKGQRKVPSITEKHVCTVYDYFKVEVFMFANKSYSISSISHHVMWLYVTLKSQKTDAIWSTRRMEWVKNKLAFCINNENLAWCESVSESLSLSVRLYELFAYLFAYLVFPVEMIHSSTYYSTLLKTKTPWNLPMKVKFF